MLTFSHVGMTCADPLATERFYSRYFNFQRARVVPLPDGKQVVFLKSGSVYLELFSADQARVDPPPTADGPHSPGLRHIAFQVDDVAAKLKEMGAEAKITLGPLGFESFIPGWRTVWIADPDGNIVEISQGFTDEVVVPPAPEAMPAPAAARS